jgi:uncharacterized protein YyaL (SSP411 family)
VDRRVYTAWNAALAVAYLDAARRCERPQLLANARHLLDSLFESAYRAGEGLAHTDGVSGQLGDHVWGMLAAMRAYQGGLGSKWLDVALDLGRLLEDRFADASLGGYFDHAGGEDLGRLSDPIKPLVENSIAAIALIELDALVGDPTQPHLGRARRALESVAALPRQYGLMAAVFARAMDRLRRPLKVTTGSEELARAAVRAHPYVVVELSDDQRAIVCVGTICLAPVSTPSALLEAVQAAMSTRA